MAIFRKTLAKGLALSLSLPLLAQDPARIGVKTGVEAITAEVDVLVLDAKGRPVTDLKPSEFALEVNGKPHPIDWVEAPPTIAEATRPAAGGSTGPAPAEAAVRRPHSTVLIVDDLHVDFRARRDGLAALRRHLASLPAEEEVAAYRLDFGVKTLQPFTRDRQAISRALDRTGRTMPVSHVSLPSSDEWVGKSRQSLRGLADLFRSLASRPEPKTVLLLAGALNPTGEVLLAAGLQRRPQGAGEIRGTRGTYSFFADEVEIENEAFLARATVIAVDPSGLRASSDVEARVTQDTARDDFAYRNDTYALIAQATGGSRVGYSNETAELVAAETARLAKRYRIGFTPDDGGSDRRDVRVVVTRAGLTVRAAKGQRSLTGEAGARARFTALLLSAESAQGDFVIRAESKGRLDSKSPMEVDVLVPLSSVHVATERGAKTARLELLIAAVDSEGRTTDLQARPFDVELLAAPPEEGGFFRHSDSFQVDPKWKGKLVLGVRDRATNRLGATAIQLPLSL